jgi:hypothetical protein
MSASLVKSEAEPDADGTACRGLRAAGRELLRLSRTLNRTAAMSPIPEQRRAVDAFEHHVGLFGNRCVIDR